MILRQIDADGDWTFGNGRQSFLTGELAIDQDIQTALMCYLNDTFWNTAFGIDWGNLIGGKDQAGIVLQCRQMISTRSGVVKINSVDSSLNRTTRRLDVSYGIDTIYSRSLTGVVSVP